MIGLYIHIPFCKSLCTYCDFPKKIPRDLDQIATYIEALKEEIKTYKELFAQIDTIYIGGGTPNALPYPLLAQLLQYIKTLNLKVKEYTIEANPELISLEQAQLFKESGISRVSLGVQTFSEKGLKILGRHHNKKEVIDSLALLRSCGISNVNIDLIFGYFGQSLIDLKNDIDIALSLNIPHISAYSLILEEKTMLNKKYKEEDLDEDLIAEMYEYIRFKLKESGYCHYEISNYAKAGYESIHNLKYWNKEEYIGVGMGATSYLNSTRSTNSSFINKYFKKMDVYIEELTLQDEKKEFMLLGLRKIKGVSKKEYRKRFNSTIEKDFNLDKLKIMGLLAEDEENIYLTAKGQLLGNIVFEEFV